MKEKYIHKSRYFYGEKISDYGLEHGYVDYATLAKSFDAVMNNEVLSKTATIGEWEPFNGDSFLYETEDGEFISEEEYEELSPEEQDKCCEKQQEVFQWFIISEGGAGILQELTDEIVLYNEELDMYLWGVTHWGTSWDYVLTDIKIDEDKND